MIVIIGGIGLKGGKRVGLRVGINKSIMVFVVYL